MTFIQFGFARESSGLFFQLFPPQHFKGFCCHISPDTGFRLPLWVDGSVAAKN